MGNKNIYYSRLRRWFSFIIIFLATVPLFLISWSSAQFYQESCLRNTAAGLKRAVENRKEVINLFLDNQKSLLSQLIRLYPYDVLRDQSQLEKIFTAVSQGSIMFTNASQGSIVDMGVIDANGRHAAYVGPYRRILMDKQYEDSLWFNEVMIKGSHISDIFLGYREVPHIVVAVTDPLKKFVLRATINSEFFNGLLRNIQMGETGDAFIVNREGDLQTPSRFDIKTLPQEETSLLEYHEGTDVRKLNDFVYVTHWIKDGEWLLLVKIQERSVLETFYHARNLDLFALLVAVAFIVIAATLLVRYMVIRIEAADVRRAEYDGQMMQVEKMASLGRLAAGVAHEVNNPLQLITDQAGWMGELLEEENRDNLKNIDEYRKSIDKIRYHVRRASAVTHRLLGFSRKMEAEKDAVDVNGLVEEAISFLDKEALHNGIAIEKHLQENIPAIMTDGPRVQQVLLNILNNSLDAIGKNGSIDITTSADDRTISIVFEDSGPGIDAKIIDKIFDPFFTTKAPGKGTGLGLSISYNIIQQLGGKLTVRNRDGGGAAFTVTLPVVQLGERLH